MIFFIDREQCKHIVSSSQQFVSVIILVAAFIVGCESHLTDNQSIMSVKFSSMQQFLFFRNFQRNA